MFPATSRTTMEAFPGAELAAAVAGAELTAAVAGAELTAAVAGAELTAAVAGAELTAAVGVELAAALDVGELAAGAFDEEHALTATTMPSVNAVAQAARYRACDFMHIPSCV